MEIQAGISQANHDICNTYGNKEQRETFERAHIPQLLAQLSATCIDMVADAASVQPDDTSA